MKKVLVPTIGSTYTHFKGGNYIVLSVSITESDRHARTILYMSLSTGKIYRRDAKVFMARVSFDEDPTVYMFDARTVWRFTYVKGPNVAIRSLLWIFNTKLFQTCILGRK